MTAVAPLDHLPEALRAQLVALLQSDDMEALKFRAEAIRLQGEASKLLDQADRLEFAATLRAGAAELEPPLADANAEITRLVAAVAAAVQAERSADDRSRAAADNSRLAADAERRAARDHADPATQTDLLVRARAASDVAARAQAAAEGATAHLRSVEQQLSAARQAAEKAEERLRLAGQLVDNPPAAPASAWTLALDGVRRLLMGDQLTDSDRDLVALFVRNAALNLGLDREFARAALAQRDREVEAKASSMFLPKPGHPLRPANPGATFVPVLPAPGR
ncbi:hypothetical protein ABZT17_25185 [Streptomyces sp. NPDC005648]|uniref:hypothetical protein n=1 Tax=Streptomyces sp. NPDC005648 TaxID=3157044 RepID=UPI0033A18E3F